LGKDIPDRVGRRVHEGLTRLHQVFEHGQIEGAIRAAFWLGLSLIRNCEQARAGCRLMRARRLLEVNKLDGV
jgi:hypothetical protein